MGQSDSREPTDFRPRNVFSTFEIEEDSEDWSFDEYELSRYNKWRRSFQRAKKFVRRCFTRFVMENWLFLVMLGVSCALVGLFIDLLIFWFYHWQVDFSQLSPFNWGSWILWIIYSILFACAAGACVMFISSHAVGSGIPEMKVILSGIEIPQYLSFRTLLAKVLGLIFAFAGGFSIGKEGPLVHICSIICNQLTRLPQFKRIRHNDAAVLQYLAVACAVGIQLAVGAPIGGILFSIEVTATYYLVDNLWRTFVVVGISQLVVRILVSLLNSYTHWDFEVAIFAKVNWTVEDYDWPEILVFIFVGVVAGIVGALFTKVLTLIIKLSKSLPLFNATKQRIFARVIGIAFLIALVAYPIELVRNDLRTVIGFFLQKEVNLVWWFLLLILLAKFLFTLLSVGFVPIPAGIYSPVFSTGVVFGRFVGELLILAWPWLTIGRGTYAVVGAAALAASVTRTISIIVIVIELSQQLRLFFPALIAVLVAIAVGRCLSSGVYDILIRQRDLPEMPPFTLLGRSSSKCAADIMRRDLKTLSIKSTFGDALNLLSHSHLSSFPLIDENGIFLGTIMRRHLESLLEENGFTLRKAQDHFDTTHLLTMAEQLEMEDETKAHSFNALETEASILSSSESSSLVNSEKQLQIYVNTQSTTNKDIIAIPTISESHHQNVNRDSTSGDVQRKAQLTDLIPYLFTSRRSLPSNAVVPVDTTVMQVTAETSLYKIHFLFTMLGLSHLYVTSKGKLVGIITRGDLIRTITSTSRSKSTSVDLKTLP